MLKAIDLATALSQTRPVRGRDRSTAPADLEAAFARLGEVGSAGLFLGRFQGDSGWERHRRGDELVHVLDGSTVFSMETDTGIESTVMDAGSLIVVPRGRWHRFQSEHGVTVLTATPQPTEHAYGDRPPDG